jgi:uncharacterized protein with GYD domain
VKGAIEMGTYFLFGEYSTDAVKDISAKRTDMAMDLIKENGGTYQSGYALLGEHDLVLIVDFPGTEQAMKASVGLAKMLGISFTTAPAVTVEQFDKLMG